MEVFTQEELTAIDAVKQQLLSAEADMERAERNRFEIWGAKLKQIRDNRWYIAFEPGCDWGQYTKDRWSITQQRAGQMIAAYDELEKMKRFFSAIEKNLSLPATESHIHSLSRLDSIETVAEVWQRVINNTNGRPITARLIDAEVQRKIAELEKNWITLEEWDKLDEAEQARLLTEYHYSTKTMNQVNENIEWAMWSWNPVTGCLHSCDYCYARDIANRFYPQKFAPSIVPDRLAAPKNTKMVTPRWLGDIGYKGVFVCSMADLFGKWVPVEWIDAVLRAIRDNPQWMFLLLTKFPVRMADFDYPANVWLGTTVDKQHAVKRAQKGFEKIKASGFQGICWLSCEPMLERLMFDSLEMFDWLVIGGASKSSRTPEYKPPFDDVVHLHNQARKLNLPIYQKINLFPGMSDDQRLREYPNNKG